MNHERRMVKIIKGSGFPLVSEKLNRNAACKCGSGKKQKHCHGTETVFYDTKPKVSEPQNENITEDN